MAHKYLAKIDEIWHKRNELQRGEGEFATYQRIVEEVVGELDNGNLRVCERNDAGEWIVNEWLKKAILLSFKFRDNKSINAGEIGWYDKVPSKFEDWSESEFLNCKIRVVPGAFARKGSYLGENVILMPSFINIGAYIDDGTMVDTWATIGSCAFIGKNCHISGGAGIGGVLEPLQANPVVIEDDCFIGARSEIAEGVHVGKGSVISMGVYIGASTKIIDRETGEIFYGRVPEYSVVVPGNAPPRNPGEPSLYCAVIVKRVDAKTRSKVSINDLLRGNK